MENYLYLVKFSICLVCIHVFQKEIIVFITAHRSELADCLATWIAWAKIRPKSIDLSLITVYIFQHVNFFKYEERLS